MILNRSNEVEMTAIKPQRLKSGDTVGIIAPASPPNKENLHRGIQFLEELGLNVKLGDNLERQYGYLAGNDKQRLDDFHNMFADPEIKAIFCACGGYGTARIAAEIDYELIKENPKIFWGYSDITFLHTAIQKNTGLVTFHGPMLASDIGKEDVHIASEKYFSQLFGAEVPIYSEELSPLDVMVSGEASGQLTGGNLSLITSTLGTPFEIDTQGKILLIEDINEEPRSVDRMLNQLHLAGKLSSAAGILVGNFHDCEPNRELTLTLDEVLDHYITLANKPALRGFLIGHCSPHIAVPLGVLASIDTNAKKVTIENGVE